MSGTQTTLSLQDKLTGPLMKMIKAMDSTINAMEKADAAAQSFESSADKVGGAAAKAATDVGKIGGEGSKILEAARSAEQASASIEAISNSSSKATDQQNKLNAALNSSPSSQKVQEIAKAMETTSINTEKATNRQYVYSKALNALRPPDSLERIVSAFSKSGQESTKASNKLYVYSKRLNSIRPPNAFERLANLFSKVGKETDSASSKQTKFNSVINQLRPSSILERLRHLIKSAGDSAEDAANQHDKFNDSINNSLPGIGKLATGLLAAVGAYKAFGAAKDFIKDIFGQGINFHAFKQASEMAFTTFLGDAKLAKQYMDDMYSFALTTPFAYPDLLESSRNLIAFGIEATNTFPIMQAIGDAVAAIGGGAQEMQSMADIFGMIQVQGKLTMMEVNRLGSHGVNAIEMLSKQAGVTGEEMKKLISEGAVGAGTAITTLVEGMDKQFGGLMAGVKGTWAGSIDSMKSAMRNAGVEMMEDFMEPLTRGIHNITEIFKMIPQYIGPAVAAFLPLIDMINEAFEVGRFDAFFAFLGASLFTIAWLFSEVAQGALWLFTIMSEYWPIIALVLGVIAAIYLPAMLAGLWAMVKPLLVHAALWAMIHWPILLIVGIVVALIGILMYFGVTTEQVLGFVGGLFFAMGAGIYNVVAHIWNVFAMFAEFLINLFIDPVYAVKKLFYDWVKQAIDLMGSLAGSFESAANILAKVFVTGANVAIGSINMLIKALNMIPGVNIGEIGELSAGTTTAISDSLKNMSNNLTAPTSDKNVVSVPRMEMKSIPGAAKSGYAAGSNMKMPSLGKVGGSGSKLQQPTFEMPNLDMGNTMTAATPKGPAGKIPKSAAPKVPKGASNPTGGKLDSIGKIEDDINIADEDLKLLLELADIRSIQSFRTLNPTVNLTGDMTIREDADIDKIIKKINKNFEDQMGESAEGVYS